MTIFSISAVSCLCCIGIEYVGVDNVEFNLKSAFPFFEIGDVTDESSYCGRSTTFSARSLGLTLVAVQFLCQVLAVIR